MHSTRREQQKSIKSVFHVPSLPTETMPLVGFGAWFFFWGGWGKGVGLLWLGGCGGVVVFWVWFVLWWQWCSPKSSNASSRAVQTLPREYGLLQPPSGRYLEWGRTLVLGYTLVQTYWAPQQSWTLNAVTWHETHSSLEMFTVNWQKSANHFLLSNQVLKSFQWILQYFTLVLICSQTFRPPNLITLNITIICTFSSKNLILSNSSNKSV